MKCFKLTVSTPDGNVFEGMIEKLSLRGIEGELAILAGHIPFVTVVKEGAVKISNEDGKTVNAECQKGMLTVSGDETVLLTSSFRVTE